MSTLIESVVDFKKYNGRYVTPTHSTNPGTRQSFKNSGKKTEIDDCKGSSVSSATFLSHPNSSRRSRGGRELDCHVFELEYLKLWSTPEYPGQAFGCVSSVALIDGEVCEPLERGVGTEHGEGGEGGYHQLEVGGVASKAGGRVHHS